MPQRYEYKSETLVVSDEAALSKQLTSGIYAAEWDVVSVAPSPPENASERAGEWRLYLVTWRREKTA